MPSGRWALQLAAGDVEAGRACLRSLCSRDARTLDSEQLASATIGSVAENISDSFVGPVLFFLIAGVPGAVFYRAVNTMDAIIGYRGRFEYLGKAAARLDDVLNFIPARLSALLLLAAGMLYRRSSRDGVRMLRRDRHKTASPNGGWPMATMAGLLGIEITKEGHYCLGEPRRPMTFDRISEAWQVARLAALLLVAAAIVVCWR